MKYMDKQKKKKELKIDVESTFRDKDALIRIAKEIDKTEARRISKMLII